MDEIIRQVLESLDSGGCIYRNSEAAMVYPIYEGCDWEAYTIEIGLFWEMYIGGLIIEHYDPITFEFDFYEISEAGGKTLRPQVKHESWQTTNDRWTVIQ